MGVASRETCTVCEQYSQHSINSPVTGDRNKCYALRQGRFTDFVVVWNVSFLWFGGYSESSFTAFRLLPFSDGRALFIDLYWCFSPDTLSLDNCPWSLSAIYPMGGPESKKKIENHWDIPLPAFRFVPRCKFTFEFTSLFLLHTPQTQSRST